MWSRLRRRLSDIPIHDPVERRQAALLQIMLISLLLADGLLIVLIALVFGATTLASGPLIPILALLLGVVIALAALRRGRLVWAVEIVISAMLLSAGERLLAAGLRAGAGILPVFTMPIVLAGLLIGRRGLALTGVSSVAIVLGVAALEQSGMLPANASTPLLAINPLGTSVIIFVLTAGMLGFLVDRFGLTLREALTAAATREQELERARASLEMRGADLSHAVAELEQDIAERERAEEKMKLSDLIISTADSLVLIADSKGEITYASPSVERVLGYSPEEVLGHGWLNLTRRGGVERESERRYLATASSGGDILRAPYERMVYDKQGRPHWILWQDTRGPANMLIGIGSDITERKQAEEALRRQNEYLASLHGTALALMNRLDLSDLLRAIITRAAQLFDVPHGYIYLVEPDGAFLELKVGVGAFSQHVGLRLKPGEGLSGHIWQTGQPLVIDDYASWPGHADYAPYARFHAAAGIPLTSGSQIVGVIGLAHAEAGRSFGGEEVALLSQFAHLASIAVDNARLYAAAQKDLAERVRVERVRVATYRISEAALSAQSLDDVFRSIHAIIGELMSARNFYIALYDEQTDQLSWPYFVDEHDTWSPPHKPGRGLTEYVLRTGRPLLVNQETFDDLRRRGEVELIGVDSLDWLGVPLKAQDKTIGVLAVQTYTEGIRFTEEHKDILAFVCTQVAMAITRKRAEEALRNSEAILHTAVEGLPFNFWVRDEQGRYVMQNSTSIRMWGNQIGKLLDDVDIPQAMKESWRGATERALAGEVVQEEVEHVVDGRKIVEYKTVAPIRDGDRIRGVLGVTIDITERKRAEEALRQAQKTESLGVLAGGIAHDFNNLLVAMLGQASLAQAQLPLESPARTPIEKAVKAAERGADLARQMLAYSGRGQFERRPIHLNTLIHENLHLFEVAVSKNVQLRMELADALPPIEGDIGQMQQVVMNLIINAAEAIGERPGTVRVITGVEDVRASDDRLWRSTGEPLAPGRYVTLEVRDNGSGMDAETLSKIFDPFFTTKFTGRGLGLAAVLGIVRGHKGGLLVDSAPGHGTTFKLFFPAVHSELIQTPPLGAAPRARAPAGGLVLVIDDEQPVREAVTDILELDGLQVITAANGAAGIALYQERQAEVRLVLLDLSMPGMGGEETFRRLRAINPDARVILSSGYSQAEATRHFVGQRLAGFIQKPYDAGTLVSTVRQHLAD